MNVEALQSILTDRLGAEREGSEFELPEDREITALLKSGPELVRVTDVKLVEFGADVTTLVTRQAEYFVEAADVFAVKLEGSRVEPRKSGPGFRRNGS